MSLRTEQQHTSIVYSPHISHTTIALQQLWGDTSLNLCWGAFWNMMLQCSGISRRWLSELTLDKWEVKEQFILSVDNKNKCSFSNYTEGISCAGCKALKPNINYRVPTLLHCQIQETYKLSHNLKGPHTPPRRPTALSDHCCLLSDPFGRKVALNTLLRRAAYSTVPCAFCACASCNKRVSLRVVNERLVQATLFTFDQNETQLFPIRTAA